MMAKVSRKPDESMTMPRIRGERKRPKGNRAVVPNAMARCRPW